MWQKTNNKTTVTSKGWITKI